KDSLYVNCYRDFDLLTLCDLNGQLVCNIYGPGWKEKDEKWNAYYSDVYFVNENIIASYVGEKAFIFDEYKRPRGNMPTHFVLFDKNGKYKQTLDVGEMVEFFCVDEENDRVIGYFPN
ncbi:6-bladed beta-propeller, partial [Marinilabiliaceae bacterium JC017]